MGKLQKMIEVAIDAHVEFGGIPPAAMMMTPATLRSLAEEVELSLVEIGDFMGVKIYTSVFCPVDKIYFGDKSQIAKMIGETEHMYSENSHG